MKSYTLTLNEEQLRLVAMCLEDVSRFASGQTELAHTVDAVLSGLTIEPYMQRRGRAKDLLGGVKRVLLPQLANNESLGYNATEFIGNTYQIYRSMLHHLAKEYNWDNVYSSPPLVSGALGGVKIETLK